MSTAIHGVSQYSVSKSPIVVQKDVQTKLESFFEIIKDTKTKRVLNYLGNGLSSASSLFTFLNGNLNWFDSIQEKLESLSETLSKFALTTIGCIGTIDLWQKKNPFSCLGYALLIPISLLTKGYDSWVARGFSYGACNAVVIIDRREVMDEKGEPVLDKNKNIQTMSGDFSKKSWSKGFTTTYKESFKMLKELYNKPSRIKDFSHALLVTTLFQMLGPIPGLFGYKATEAVIRNISSVVGDAALLLDKKDSHTSSQKSNILNLKSPIVQSSVLWICTATIDLLKRFDFISNNVNNLTELSSLFDRSASIRFTQGVLSIKESKT